MGKEQKGTNFSRPVVIIKKFNNDVFRGVALSTKIKTGTYYYQFTINKVPQCAILSQVRLYDAKGLVRKIGMINLPDFQTLKQKIKSLL
jgi:mRNA interferase MazF